MPVGAEAPHLTPQAAVQHCDENTIGVVAILGSTFDGSYEPVQAISAALDRLEAETGVDVPIHVDAASGGFVAPFLDPALVWDFRLRRVQSINASGHKYGLVYPGVGWVVWREQDALPQDLVFRVDYLGGDMPTFALNFSRPGAQVIAQYYTFIRLGHDGYRRVQQASRDTARWLSDEIARLGPFELLSTAGSCPSSRSASPPASSTTASTTSRSCCAREAGSSRPTGCRAPSTTWPSCGSACATASRETSPTC